MFKVPFPRRQRKVFVIVAEYAFLHNISFLSIFSKHQDVFVF